MKKSIVLFAAITIIFCASNNAFSDGSSASASATATTPPDGACKKAGNIVGGGNFSGPASKDPDNSSEWWSFDKTAYVNDGYTRVSDAVELTNSQSSYSESGTIFTSKYCSDGSHTSAVRTEVYRISPSGGASASDYDSNSWRVKNACPGAS